MIPWFQFTTVHIGPIPIQVWGFWVALGMVIAFLILSKRAKARGEKSEMLLNQALWMILGGIIFARLFHVFFYEPRTFLAEPLEIVRIWHGGLSSFGGFFGAAVGYWFFSKKHAVQCINKKLFDEYAFAGLYGWMIGRIGCVMIHDHLGKQCHCFFAFLSPDGPRLDMAFLEIIGLLPLAVFFFIHRKKQHPPGWFFSLVFIYYGLLRVILDFFRATDIATADTRYLGLTPGQYFAIVLVGIGAYTYRKLHQIGRIA